MKIKIYNMDLYENEISDNQMKEMIKKLQEKYNGTSEIDDSYIHKGKKPYKQNITWIEKK